MPLVFSRLMLGLKDGVNRVVMGLPAALHVPLSMLLRIPGQDLFHDMNNM